MADAIFDLEHVLRSKPEQATLQELSIIRAWKAQAKAAFYLGLSGGSAVAWLATRRLTKVSSPLRLALTSGAGAVCGVWLCARSLGSSVEGILSLEGSRIQREMANIMLSKHHDNPWVQRLVSKHFYPEEVYVDSSTDKPVFRWRYRNFSGEYVNHSQSTTSYREDETNPKENKINNTPTLKSKQQVSATDAGTESPFDIVLGVTESAGDGDPQPTTSAPLEPSRRQMHKEKRTRRRHRRQHRHEESDDE
ncbi:hypothetical protein ACS0TY_023203 [Phlomoides rotata]